MQNVKEVNVKERGLVGNRKEIRSRENKHVLLFMNN
jgi:hypothetical protein